MTLKVNIGTGGALKGGKKGTSVGTAPLNSLKPGDEGYCDAFVGKLSEGQRACLAITSISGGAPGTVYNPMIGILNAGTP